MKESNYQFGAAAAGGMLAVMVFLNGRLAVYTSPVWSSLIVHGIGIAGSWLVWRLVTRQKQLIPFSDKAPAWTYMGGALGAAIVIVANVTVNSPIGLVGSVALMILGQTAFALWFDHKGWFGLPRRSVNRREMVKLGLILIGALLIIAY